MRQNPMKRAAALLVSAALILGAGEGVLRSAAATPPTDSVTEQESSQNTVSSAEAGGAAAEAGQEAADGAQETEPVEVMEEVHIASAADLTALAAQCQLDTWSRTRRVILDASIDLNGIDFAGIPTFGGVFDGQGYTISNLSMTGDGSCQGLFRYVQPGALVENLDLTAVVLPGGSQEEVGALAGSNSGTLNHCTVRVVVRGSDSVGGVAGVNHVSGIITNCTSKGIVYGEHFVGGVAGDNEGLISGCRSYCSVNTTEEQNDVDLSTLTVGDLTGTENAVTITDIGGIAGGNEGVLRACINNGAVGYYHIGYNIGGIAGSQTGFIEGCVNYGTVSGRKEVGGIVGQMEPSNQIEFSQDRLQATEKELITLQGLVNKACRDASGATSSVSNELNSLRKQVNAALSSTQQMMGEVTNTVQNVHDTDLSQVVGTVLPSPLPSSLPQIDNLPTLSPEAAELLNGLTGEGVLSAQAEPQPTPVPETAEAQTAGAKGSLSLVNLSAGGQGTYRTITQTDLGQSVGEVLDDAASAVEGVIDALPTVPPDVTLPTAAPDVTLPTVPPDVALPTVPPDVTLPTLSPDEGGQLPPVTLPTLEPGGSLSELLPDALPTLPPDALDKVMDSASSVVNTDAILAAQNALSGNISQAMAALNSLNGSAAKQSQALIADIQAINAQMAKVAQTLTGTQSASGETIIEDISGQDSDSDTSGKVCNCINTAAVQGDLNVGGIAGAMAVENDLDPEDDISVAGSASLNVTLRSRVVLRGCTSSGSVLAKKAVAGGIVGQQEMGAVMTSSSRCTVTVESGNDAGGIAGLSKGEIRDCNAKCRLSGNAKVGGIAGEGAVIDGCYAMLAVDAGSEAVGSIAGEVADIEQLVNNFYAASKWGAVDNISYAGRAEGLEYADFAARDGVPEMFRVMTLTFVANGSAVDTRSCAYGGSIDVDTLPEIMPSGNKRQVWPDGYYSEVTFDQTVEAVDAPNCSVLESSQTRGEQPVVLAEGTFGTEDALTLAGAEGAPFGQTVLDRLSLAVGGVTLTVKDGESQTALETWEVVLPNDGAAEHRIRYLPSQEAKNVQIYLKTESGWTAVDSTQNGSYLSFDAPGSDIIFCAATKATQTVPPLIFAAGVVIFLILCIVRGLRRHMRRKERRARKAAPRQEAAPVEAKQTAAQPEKQSTNEKPKPKPKPKKEKSGIFGRAKRRREKKADAEATQTADATPPKPAQTETEPDGAPKRTADTPQTDNAAATAPARQPLRATAPDVGRGGVWGRPPEPPTEPVDKPSEPPVQPGIRVSEAEYQSFSRQFGEAYDDEEP